MALTWVEEPPTASLADTSFAVASSDGGRAAETSKKLRLKEQLLPLELSRSHQERHSLAHLRFPPSIQPLRPEGFEGLDCQIR